MSVRVRRLRKHAVELDITAFMNLIVVLVPFLLSSAVLSRLAVLELNLPAGSSSFANLKESLQLEIVIRRNSFEVGDRVGGLIRRIEPNAGSYDYPALSVLMQHAFETPILAPIMHVAMFLVAGVVPLVFFGRRVLQNIRDTGDKFDFSSNW